MRARLYPRTDTAEGAGVDGARLVIVGDHATRLGHGPHLDQWQIKALFKHLMLAGLNTGTQRKTQGVLALFVARRELEQNVRNHTLKLRDGRAGGHDILPPSAGMKTVRENQTTARNQHAWQRNRQTIRMMQRQRIVETLDTLGHRQGTTQRQIIHAEGMEILVGEYATLGTSGGA